MTVEQTNLIDIISQDKLTGDTILTISDHLDWADTVRHQTILQSKLNAYLAFVESGEILTRYPASSGRSIIFNIVFKFRPNEEALAFLTRATDVIAAAGFTLQWKHPQLS